MGGLLSRSGFEEKMDDAWAPSTNSLTPSKEMKDIFDGETSKASMASFLVLVAKKVDMFFLSAWITSIPWVTNRLGRRSQLA